MTRRRSGRAAALQAERGPMAYGGKGPPGPQRVYASWLPSPTRCPRSNENPPDGSSENFLVTGLTFLSLSTDAKGLVSEVVESIVAKLAFRVLLCMMAGFVFGITTWAFVADSQGRGARCVLSIHPLFVRFLWRASGEVATELLKLAVNKSKSLCNQVSQGSRLHRTPSSGMCFVDCL